VKKKGKRTNRPLRERRGLEKGLSVKKKSEEISGLGYNND